MGRFLAILFFVLMLSEGFCQRPSEKCIDSLKYRSSTSWSCADKNFGYYYFSYSLPISFEKSEENPLKSRLIDFGYVYRYKIAKPIDCGIGLGYSNRKSFVKKNSLKLFDESNHFNKINTYHHYLDANVFLRVNLDGANYRKLGCFMDFGFAYKYAFSYGSKYVHSSKFLDERSKFKNPNYLSPHCYGPYLRLGHNYVSLIVSYTFEDWIRDYGLEKNNYNRGNLLVGLQLNLYSK